MRLVKFSSAVLVVSLAVALGARSGAAASDTTPSGMVAFFMLSQCPTGWATATEAQGRLLLGVTNGNNIKVAVGTPLANATAPTHQHAYQTSVSVVYFDQWLGVGGYSDATHAAVGTYPVPDNPPGATDASIANLPLVQLLVCRKQ